jgi:hypothetical protein
MKKSLSILTAALAAAALHVAAPFAASQDLLASWNFNDQTAQMVSGSAPVPASYQATLYSSEAFAALGAPVMTTNILEATIVQGAGTLLGSGTQPAGDALNFHNRDSAGTVNLNRYLLFTFDVSEIERLDNFTVQYATYRSQGFNKTDWEWSTDGTNFVLAGIVNVPVNTYVLQTVDFDFGGALAAATTLYIRNVLTGGGSTAAGYTRIDNVTFLGAVTAIPEPSTYAFLLGGLALAGVGLSRRLRAKRA